MSVRSRYVRQRPDDSRRIGVQCSVMDQRRVTCTSVAVYWPFCAGERLTLPQERAGLPAIEHCCLNFGICLTRM
jgi:hypothetical protein